MIAGIGTDLCDVRRIDAALPQTQCTRCGYPDCRGYADAVAAGYADINQCPPGGAEGVARLAAYVRLMRAYPLVAIGGIALEQFPEILATGVGSIAVVRALVNAPDPEAAADGLMQAMGK